MRKRLIAGFLTFALALSSAAPLGNSSISLINANADTMNTADMAAAAYSLNYPTQDEIRAQYKKLTYDLDKSTTYKKNYSLKSPYDPGDVSDADRKSALNALNFCRYVAGLPSDVEIKSDYNEYTQAASLINAVNGTLSHYPDQPKGMSDSLYEKGLSGASSSNISYGYTNITASIIRGYMVDSDSSNIDRLGHRRWILNPEMKYTGFGKVGSFSALYAFDGSRSGSFTGDYIAWPGQNMPNELYQAGYDSDYAFSVTLGDAYDTPSLSKVTVDIKSQKLNKSWHLDKNSTSISSYLNVNNDWYGQPKCIIFNVGMFPVNDKVTVTIKGITKNNVSSPITYTVNFFELEHSYKTTVVPPTYAEQGYTLHKCTVCGDSYKDNYKTKKTLAKASTTKYTSTTTAVRINWNKVTNAKGYRIYRYNTSTKKWDTVKTISNANTTTFKQTGLKAGTTYKYKIKAYVKENGNTYWGEASDTFITATKPAKVKITRAGKSKTAVRLYWNKVTGASGYEIQKYNSSKKKWEKVTLVSSTETNYKITGLKSNTAYKFRIRAYKNAGAQKTYSAWSDTKKATTKK